MMDSLNESIEVPDFVTYSSSANGSPIQFSIEPTSETEPGTYEIIIEVTDSDSEGSGSELGTSGGF